MSRPIPSGACQRSDEQTRQPLVIPLTRHGDKSCNGTSYPNHSQTARKWDGWPPYHSGVGSANCTPVFDWAKHSREKSLLDSPTLQML